jgi:hypothetical protein
MHICVFINPFSGKTIQGFFSEERIKDIFSKYLSREHSFEFVKTENPDELPSKISYILKKADIVALVGGDGTIKTFIDLLIPMSEGEKKIPIIAPIGAGSLNVVAKNVLPQTVGTAPRLICDIVNSFSSFPDMRFVKMISPLKFEEENLVQYGFMFGNGVIFSGAEIYDSWGFGSQKAFSLIIKAIFSFFFGGELKEKLTKYISCEIKVDGSEVPIKRAVACLASLFDKMILFTRPFISKPQEGKFFFAVFGDSHKKLALNFLNIALGRKVLENSINSLASEVFLKFEGGYTIDGEIFRRSFTEMKISLGPKIPFLSLNKK